MKKIEFALEVLILVAVIPVYVFLEMNHGTRQLPVNDMHTNHVKQAGQNMIAVKSSKNYQLKTAL